MRRSGRLSYSGPRRKRAMSMIWLPPTRYDWYVDLSGERAFTDDHLILLCAACG